LDAESCGGVELVAKTRLKGQNGCPLFFDNYDVIVAITTVCATMVTLLIGLELDAESCGSVELVARGG